MFKILSGPIKIDRSSFKLIFSSRDHERWEGDFSKIFTMHAGKFIIFLPFLSLSILCCFPFVDCKFWFWWSWRSRGGWITGRRTWLLSSPLFLWRSWRIRALYVFEHFGHRLLPQSLFKLLRGPCWKRKRTGIYWVSKRSWWKIRTRFEFVHPTGCTARWAIPPNMCHMLNICRVPNFHLSLFHNKYLGDKFEALVDPFNLGCHGGEKSPKPRWS